MKRYILVAEKPSLMKDIKNAYEVCKGDLDFTIDFNAFAGHTLGLWEPEQYDSKWSKPYKIETLPIIVDEFKFKVTPEKQGLYDNVFNKLKSSHYDGIINATDCGREGQAIFWTFYYHAKVKLPVKRLWFPDQTETELVKALKNLIDEDNNKDLCNMRDASLERIFFDWEVGMNFSRAVSLKAKKGIAVGRVMTPTLNMVVTRDLIIENFKPEKYYEVVANFDDKYSGRWFDEKTKETSFSDKEKANKFIEGLKKSGTVESVETKRATEKPPQLFSLSQLQSEANKTYGFTAQEVLDLAQSLYEKHKILSYPRTSCRVISSTMSKEIKDHLLAIKEIDEVKDFVTKITTDTSRIDKTMKDKHYVDNTKLTDHHALLPTKKKPNLSILSDKEKKLYMLVVKSFVAIFLDPCLMDKTTIITNVSDEKFKTTGSVIIDEGYRVLYKKDKKDKEKDDTLPKVVKGEVYTVKKFDIEEKETSPPQPYTDSTLLEAMKNSGKFIEDIEMKAILKEKEGIGTEPTRGSIIEKLLDKGYLFRKGKTIRSSEFGRKTIEILKDKKFASPLLTAEWEKKLREIEDDIYDKVRFEKEMKEYISGEVKDIIDNLNYVFSPMDSKESIGTCPLCSGKVVITDKYYLCENYKKEPKNCSFVIGKSMNGGTISESNAKKLINLEPTTKIKFKKKSDNSVYETSLIFDKTEKKITFNNQKTEQKEIGVCPICSGKIFDMGNYVWCENKREKKCEFSLSKEILGCKLKDKDIKNIIDGKETEEKELNFSKGKSKVKLKYNKSDKKLEFIFSNKK